MLHTHITLLKDFRVSALISAGLLAVLAGLFFFPTASMEETKAAPASGETTLSMTAENVNLDLNITNPNGTFSASTPSEFTVSTSSQAGYTLRLQAKDDNSDSSKLVNGEYAFNSISSASADGTDFNNGNWGIKPSKFNSTDNTNFLPAPNIDGVSLDETDSANVEANTYTLALAAKSDYTLPAGIYSNTFVLTATANSTGYTIIYDGNDDYYYDIENIPEPQTVSMTQPSVELSSQIPSTSGWQFFGWCDGTIPNAGNDETNICDGDVYQPGDTYYIDLNSGDTTTLYAIWGYSTITFDGNGGEIDMYDITWDEYSGSTIDVGSPYDAHKSGYVFNGWNTKADGTGVSASCTLYEGEESYIENCSINTSDLSPTITTLYAQWTNQVTVHFYADSSYATGETADQIITIGTPTRLNPHTFTSDDYVLDYWYSDDSSRISCQNECEDEDIITISDDVNVLAFTLHSEWTDEVHVSYDGNGADSGSMEDDEYIHINDELSPNEFVKNGRIFTGWNTKADGTGQAYDTYFSPAPKTKHVTLYAQWRSSTETNPFYIAMDLAGKVKYPAIDGNNYYRMQDMATSICNTVTTPTASDYSDTPEAQLVDSRDGKLYWIAKLKDGKCWMTQNLDFDIPSTSLSSEDTDLNDFDNEGYNRENGYTISDGIIYWTPDYATEVPQPSYNGQIETPESIDVGDWYWTDEWYDSYDCESDACDYLNNSTNKFSTTMPQIKKEHSHVGNYYNWAAAIASNQANVFHDDELLANNSICPRGWKLMSKQDRDPLYNYYSSGTDMDKKASYSPTYFVRGGEYVSGGLEYAGEQGHYWTVDVVDFETATYLVTGSYDFDLYGGWGKEHGKSVRCVAR